MNAEFDIGGVFFSSVLVSALVALIATTALHKVLVWAGLYRRIWHPALFEAGLFVIVWAGVVTFRPSLLPPGLNL